jgi:hypothetical protein
MKTEIYRGFGSQYLALIVACNSMIGAVQTDAATDTNVYKIYALAGDDDGGVTMDRYATVYHANHAMMFNGLSGPLPEQLPANRDTNGHWGPVVNGWQLSVRFRHGEFLTNEPVVAMIMLRNVNAPFPSIFKRLHSEGRHSEARKNFSYALRHGTNTLTWSWTDPPLDPMSLVIRQPRYFWKLTIEPRWQAAFFVRLDQIFDLSQPGEYSVQVSWPERSTTVESLIYRESGTNIVSGVAGLHIVDKLSDFELKARKRLEETYQAANRAAAELQQKELRERARREMTNKPSAK